MDRSGTDGASTGWGILATGRIAHGFARDLHRVPGARVAAVGSRRAASAEAFAAEHGGPDCRAHGSYEALVEDPAVDVVYVASPHALHLEHARLALRAGKHVLCEKPLTLNTAEAEAMVALAREHDRFLMEAMWMACHPVLRAVCDGLAQGRFGRPRQLHADLGFVVERPAGDRLVEPELGAGALLDMGVYPLTLADLLLGPAEQLTAVAGLSDTGFDLDVAIAGRYAGGATAALTASMTPGRRGPPRWAPTPAAWSCPPTSTTRRTPCGRRATASRSGSRASARCSATAWATRRPRCSGAWRRACARARWSRIPGHCG
jgi:predicted dehydrogenase